MTPVAEAFERVRPLLLGRLLVASDFDGTISRLGLDPWRAGIIPRAQRALRRLAAAPCTDVALISGRTVADLAARARIGGISYHGDHGAQWAVAPRGFRVGALHVEHEAVDPSVADMVERLKVEVPARIEAPWLLVEDKGSAVTFHFRGAPDVAAARARVRATVDALDPGNVLDRPGGRRAWEVRPPGATTKAVALEGLIDRLGPESVIMLGDDRHDVGAFDTLRAARARGRTEALAIGVLSPAADPAELVGRADVVLATSEEAARFLGLVARERT